MFAAFRPNSEILNDEALNPIIEALHKFTTASENSFDDSLDNAQESKIASAVQVALKEYVEENVQLKNQNLGLSHEKEKLDGLLEIL